MLNNNLKLYNKILDSFNDVDHLDDDLIEVQGSGSSPPEAASTSYFKGVDAWLKNLSEAD